MEFRDSLENAAVGMKDIELDSLDAINRDAYALANMWHNTINQALVDPNKTKGIPPAINALCRKIYRWLTEEGS